MSDFCAGDSRRPVCNYTGVILAVIFTMIVMCTVLCTFALASARSRLFHYLFPLWAERREQEAAARLAAEQQQREMNMHARAEARARREKIDVVKLHEHLKQRIVVSSVQFSFLF